MQMQSGITQGSLRFFSYILKLAVHHKSFGDGRRSKVRQNNNVCEADILKKQSVRF